MTILGILLTILKIIGIVLLILLLLILTIILLILFVPVRYRVHADKVGWDLNAGANVSWLLRMISVDVSYGIRESGYGGGLTKDIRIFGISIFKIRDWLSSRKKKKSKAAGASESVNMTEESIASSADEILDGQGHVPEPPHEETGGGKGSGEESAIAADESPHTETGSAAGEPLTAGSDSAAGEIPDTDISVEAVNAPIGGPEKQIEDSVDEAEPEVRSLTGRISGILQRANGLLLGLPGRIYGILITIFMKILEFFTILCGIPGRIVAIFGEVIDKILTIFGKITLITDFFFDDKTQDAIHLVLGKTGNLLGHIRPRKLSGYLDFGFDDPSITGRVLGVLSVFLPQVGKTFDINPDFEKSHLECDITSSGRIYLFYLVYIAASTYFNKNIKYVIRYFRHLRKELSQA